MRKPVLFVVVLALGTVVAVPLAQAHRLSLVRAHSASVELSEFACGELAECTGSQVDPCRRLSAHKVRCKGHLFLEDPQMGVAAECTWDDHWSIKRRSRQLRWSEKVFDQTLQCLDVPPTVPPAVRKAVR